MAFPALPAGIPQASGTPLSVVPNDGIPQGSFLDPAPHEIPAGGGRYLQDVLLDVPNEVRQRGVIDTLDGTYPQFPSLPSNWRTIGMTSLADPNGTDAYRILLLGADQSTGALHAIIYGRGAVPTTPAFHARAFFELADPIPYDGEIMGDPTIYFDDRRTANLSIGKKFVDLTLSGITVNPSNTDPFFDAKPSLDGGVLIGIGQNFGPDSGKASHRALYHWRGAGLANYHPSASFVVTQSSPTVTHASASFLANVEPGMFLLDTSTGALLGIVKSVDSNTQITLERNVLRTTGTTLDLTLASLRQPFSGKQLLNSGNITVAAAATTVSGGNTKFVDQGVANGDLVFKASDLTYIGTVTSVQSNTGLTLAAGAAIGLSNEDYFITRATGFAAGTVPVFTAYWQGIQLAANSDNIRNGKSERTRVFVIGPDIVDNADLTQTGAWYDMPATKPHQDIRGIFPTESAALVFLAEQTYGLFGTTPDALTPRLVLGEDGLLSPMAVQSWKGGAVWAGHKSVYHFDGANVQDLLKGRAQVAHQKALGNIDYSQYRAWSMLYNGHYVLFLQKVNPDVFSHRQERLAASSEGGGATLPESIIYAINLESGALTFFTNVAVRGFTSPPGKLVNERDAYYVVENSVTSGPAIASAESLFTDSLTQSKFQDDVITNPAKEPYAPHIFVETRLADYGDPERLKNFKQFQLQYLLFGSDSTPKLGIDVVTGLSQDGTALTPKDVTTLDHNTRTWKNVRSRFTRSSTHIAFRFYTLNDVSPSSVLLGPMAAGMKLKRPGRV